jgi:RNA polymerase sigma factor (sigma-70 family)
MMESDNHPGPFDRGDAAVPSGSGNAGTPLDARAAQMLLFSEQPRLLAYIERHLPGAVAAVIQPTDVLQDVYIDAFRRLGSFVRHDETSVYRWLVTIARAQIAMLLRRQRAVKRGRGDTVNVSQATDSLVLMLEDLAVTRHTPSRSAASHEVMAVLEQALDRLGGGHAEAIRLRYVDGLTAPEVAARMGRTVAAVHMLCQRGLQAVRRDLRSASQFI